MNEMTTGDYNRAFWAIGLLMREGMSAKDACDKVTHQFRHLIGGDDAASECLYEEAQMVEDAEREAYQSHLLTCDEA